MFLVNKWEYSKFNATMILYNTLILLNLCVYYTCTHVDLLSLIFSLSHTQTNMLRCTHTHTHTHTHTREHSDIEILYGGTLLFDYEVSSAVTHDLFLATGSVVAIIVVMMILTGFSIWLTFFGFYTILSCFPIALFVFKVVLGEWVCGWC